jgi:hypothetical protein
MKSATLPSFWTAYRKLDDTIKRNTRKAYQLWSKNPFHPSLHFKCLNPDEDVWAVRVSRGYRALGIFQEDSVTWFWIGSHTEYERYFRKNS